MPIVHVLFLGVEGEPLGIFSTKEKADEAVNQVDKSWHKFDFLIEEYTLDKLNPLYKKEE